ncbi:hypothetical protein [Umezakia ovalisporum]|jgi:hypothetical protein|uniref:Uncharacterized protein n=2 Tax=Umezakia ovalisporum TaxID=75695 RepID=A0AA43KFB7_9CYAN|nr:hypothetical protein [Umezakia ovalisporum]MBI1241439.1 hypothetical protein [Nostoc sp. RI_552]MDH6058152.1 hypothetical protein [Umezakia ovalisporum FSS-43]MDH6064541.1 hypothetical protein [Umezakia ovalisporum FSS-62]MDH6066293.1 hypothetical protein [Umezakia ovalisporum APH033B]MDH6071852.1 hypothetical protein [Umezakia ovalisporum CobakiLakeA]
MSLQITKSELFEELSAEQQELLAGGEFSQTEGFDGQVDQFDQQDQFDRRRDSRDGEKRLRRIPIRLTGVLEVIK